MTTMRAFQEICWWLVPLALGGLCFLINVKKDAHNGSRKRNLSGSTSLGLLDRRYVSGEIGPIEYEDKVLTMGLKRRW